MNLVVELLGAPGVGKSTLVPQLRSRLQDLPTSAPIETSRGEKYLALGRYSAAHPGLIARSIATIAATRQRTTSDLGWVLRTWIKRCWRHASLRSCPGLHLVDAGIAQALWSIGFRARRRLDIARLGYFGVPDVLIVVDASPETIIRRLSSRPGSQSRFERGNQHDDFERPRQLVVDIRDQLVTRGVTAIDVSNDRDDDLDDVASAIATRVRARWST